MKTHAQFPVLTLGIAVAVSCATDVTTPPPDPSVASVTVSPGSVTLNALDATQLLTATALDADGNVVPNQTFAWASGDPQTAAVSNGGTVTAVADGSTDVTATLGTISGSATVTVDQAVASVTVTPATGNIPVGQTLQLAASASDANGYAVPGATFAWGSSNTQVITVDNTGLATGVGNGSATISATFESVMGTAALTGGTPASTVYFTEGFEDTNFSGRNWYDNSGLTITSAEAHSGSSSLEWHFTSGATTPVGRGAIRHLFTETESVYLSYWVKYSANWVGSGNPFHPHEFYFLTNEEGQYAGPAYTHLTAYIEHNYQSGRGGVPLVGFGDGMNIDNSQIGVDLSAVTEDRGANGCNGDTDGYPTDCYSIGGGLFQNGKIFWALQDEFSENPGPTYKNDWHHVEVYMQLNTIQNGIGQTDGIVQYWLDGNLIINHTDVLIRTGLHSAQRFNQLLLGPYIGGSGSPVDQRAWIDDLSVGDKR